METVGMGLLARDFVRIRHLLVSSLIRLNSSNDAFGLEFIDKAPRFRETLAIELGPQHGGSFIGDFESRVPADLQVHCRSGRTHFYFVCECKRSRPVASSRTAGKA
jgi:hypothetical protein